MSARRARGEDGATLILVIGFMVMIGFVLAGLSSQLSNSLTTRTGLVRARDREYDADAAIETAITQVRNNINGANPCSGVNTPSTGPNGVSIQVTCNYKSGGLTLSGAVRREATFAACESSCGPSSSAIIKAQVSFASLTPPNSSPIVVNKTYIESWSVNR